MSKNTFRGLTSSIPQQLLLVLLLFAAVPLQMFGGDVRTYQGVSLKKPAYRSGAYQVGSREELLWWALNDQSESLSLIADINLQGGKQLLTDDGQALKLLPNQVVVWPYVYYNSSCPTIDGNNHTISGLYQKNGYGVEGNLGSYEAYDWVGFVSYSKPTITIKNLNIADSYFEGKVAGGFMGQKSKHATSTSTANLVNCSFRGFVEGEQYAGGFVGHYRTDGQDANIYRCINYGTVRAGNYFDNDIYAAAGGIVGYLDVTHAAFAKANTNFNRCVNYGSISNVTPGANVGGIVGRVWDNNNGVREWRFCFNFGEVTKLDQKKNKLAGSGLIGNYVHTNGKSEPKILSCGNARKSDTGALLDSLTWNAKGNAPVLSGFKVIESEKLISSIKEDKSWIAWWNNNYDAVSVLSALIPIAIGLAGLIAYAIVEGAAMAALYLGIGATAAIIVAGQGIGQLVDNGDLGAIYNSIRSNTDASKQMANTPLIYSEKDVRTAYFAYDCNLMMQSDSVGHEKNEDKSILFEQHINLNDSTQNDRFPKVIASTSSRPSYPLYYGYKDCNRMPRIGNDEDLSATPCPHTFTAEGSCSVCGLKLEPLDVVTKQVGDKIEVDYYTIKNVSQLKYLASVFNGEDIEGSAAAYKLYNGATFKLLNDITFEDDVMWSPIGSYADYGTGKTSDKWHPFKGNFDGQGHTIRGLRTDESVNYAGLFGDVHGSSTICNVKLSDCTFNGNVVGSIAGRLDTKEDRNPLLNSAIVVDRVGVDSSVVVTAVSVNEKSCGGGLFGMVNPYVDKIYHVAVTNCYSNATLLQRNKGYKADAQNMMGAFVGAYYPEQYNTTFGITKDPTFKYCYFGGSSVKELNYVGKVMSDLNGDRFVNCYMVGDQTKPFDNDNSSSHRVVRSYISSGHLAYDLMLQSSTANKYYWGQDGSYPVLVDDTSAPSLCKVNIYPNSIMSNIGDTIINKRGARLPLPFNYAGSEIGNQNLLCVKGWANDNYTDTPTEIGATGKVDLLYNRPWHRYDMFIEMLSKSAQLEVYNEYIIQIAGSSLGGSEKTKFMVDLNLTGGKGYALNFLPKEIDGNYHSMRIEKSFFDEHSAIDDQRDSVLVRNLCVKGDTLSKGILLNNSKKEVKRIFRNVITIPTNLDKSILSYFSESEKEHNALTTLENVVNKRADSTALCISNGKGNDVKEVTFSDANKNNTYESILGYMLSHNMLDTFGLRLDGKNEKVAGKFGFAADADKRIYHVKIYNQATGAESGEVLMNYDGQCTFKVDDGKLGKMTEGIPAGYFAVLPMTKEELGNKFLRLAANVITKDGCAAVIRLNDKETKGFAYPSCFPGSDKDINSITITANRAEYVRKVRRDGAHEGIYLPFAFTSLEFDENELQGDDKMDIAFIDAVDGDGLSADGTKFELSSLSSYHAEKDEQETDPSDDEIDMLFIAGVPYFININCSERTYTRTEITFVGNNVGFLREPFALEAFEPLYGTFKETTVGEVAKDMNVYILAEYNYPGTGEMYEKFVRVYDGHELSPFRCYLATNKVEQPIRLTIDGNDVTGINNVVKGSVEADGKMYDILGRRINAANAKGVYIKNGKKVINLK